MSIPPLSKTRLFDCAVKLTSWDSTINYQTYKAIKCFDVRNCVDKVVAVIGTLYPEEVIKEINVTPSYDEDGNIRT